MGVGVKVSVGVRVRVKVEVGVSDGDMVNVGVYIIGLPLEPSQPINKGINTHNVSSFSGDFMATMFFL